MRKRGPPGPPVVYCTGVCFTARSPKEWRNSMKTLYSILIAIAALVLYGQTASGASPDLHSWSTVLDNNRFEVLNDFSGAAVLDKETGLVWVRSLPPPGNPFDVPLPWSGTLADTTAADRCNFLTVANRRGWRLPTFQELVSLVDPTASSPALPAGHPFSNVHNDWYWSATTSAKDPGYAWVVNFDDGSMGLQGKSVLNFVWCVRGGQGVDPQ